MSTDPDAAATVRFDDARASVDEIAEELATTALAAFEGVEPHWAESAAASRRILGEPDLDSSHYDRALLHLAAALYLDAAINDADIVAACAALVARPDAPIRAVQGATWLLGLTAAMRREPLALRALEDAAAQPNRTPEVHAAALDALFFAAEWAAPLLDAASLVRLLEVGHLSHARPALLEGALERSLLADPARLDAPTFARLNASLADTPSWTTVAAFLAERPSLADDVREAARSLSRDAFPLRESVARLLGGRRPRVLLVQNIADGQGDEIIRSVPLVQALLAFRPNLTVTLITARAYLYAHPRVRVVPIDDRGLTRTVLSERYEAVIDFFEPNVLELNHDAMLEQALDAALRARPAAVRIAADKGWNRFVHQRVDVALRPIANERGLDRVRVDSVHEPTHRLLLELGLPTRMGEETPEPSVLAGRPSTDAEREWERLTATNQASRPVALVNPFGGSDPLKGYIERRADQLARRMNQLVTEGFHLVVLPNGTTWGDDAAARRAVGLMDAPLRQHVTVAPDPGAFSGTVRVPDLGGLEIPHPAYRMRLTTHFLRLADLIVTVEGWMMHAAYLMGRPYRVLMPPYAHGAQWHPYGQSTRQGLCDPAPRTVGAGTPSAGPPLPDQPRKQVLEFILQRLASLRQPAALPFIRRALHSEDRDIRRFAVPALAAVPEPAITDELVTLLRDPSAGVRGAAAGSLTARTNRPSAITTELLLAHQWIAAIPAQWNNVIGLGAAARAAVEIASRDDDPVVRREARQVIERLG